MTPPPEEVRSPDEATEADEPIGPFPTWKALYLTVVVWWAIMLLILWIFTVTFDYSAS